MSLKNARVVDAFGIEKTTGNVVLTIADELDWSDEKGHLLALQEKLNAYIEFIESGQLIHSCPESKDRKIVIDVVVKFRYPNLFKEFVSKAQSVLDRMDVKIRYRIFEGLEDMR